MFLTVAVLVVLWWVVLFATLPIGLRTQDEEGNVTLGTVPSAPGRTRHVVRAMSVTTLVTLALYLVYLGAKHWLGVTLDDLPSYFPTYHT